MKPAQVDRVSECFEPSFATSYLVILAPLRELQRCRASRNGRDVPLCPGILTSNRPSDNVLSLVLRTSCQSSSQFSTRSPRQRMSEPGKKPIVKDEIADTPKIRLEVEQSRGALATKQQVEAYLRRKAEVMQDDHQAFADYLKEKSQRASEYANQPPPKPKFNRRNILKVVAGT